MFGFQCSVKRYHTFFVSDSFLPDTVSEKEKELIENRIELSGLKKSEFFIQSCLYQAILVKGNVHAFDKIRECLKDIGTEISKVESLSKIDIETLLELRTIIELLKFVYR